MSSSYSISILLFITLFHFTHASSRLLLQDSTSLPMIRYHNGPLLRGPNIAVNLIWYGNFTSIQRSIVSDFILSLSSSIPPQPSVATWWKSLNKYYRLATPKSSPSPPSLRLGRQILDQSYSLGKSLSDRQIVRLASRGDHINSVNVVLTAADVTVNGFCVNHCGTHGYRNGVVKGKRTKYAYIWAGNSEAQCPGYCAWPFHQPIYGPQGPPLVAPNNDVGLDGIVMNFGGLLMGTATNPFGNGFYQGPAGAQLEAATACTGVYGRGAYPGYAGELLVDSTSGGSYNAHGVRGRKYLLPAILDPSTAKCSTLV